MKAITWTKWGAWALGCVASVLAQAQSLVGRTAGEAGVSVTGAARYVVPLPLPAGTNGLAPALSVAYDSRGGHGLLGAGFQLKGLSSIQRCGRTLVQDGAVGAVALDATDRFCLDGKRLRLTAGTHGAPGSRYQTEIEEFSRVTAVGTAGAGPASFVLESREGLIYEYGATNDSRLESGASATPRTWAVNRIRDRSGNYIDFAYAEDAVAGSHRPAAITYTGNLSTGATAYYTVRFVYEPRPAGDVLNGYVAGVPWVESQRLDRIDVVHLATGTVVRRFDFSYASSSPSGRSRLASLQVCGGSECLPATRFDWEQYSTGWSWWDTGTGIDASRALSVTPGDVDGDGFEDLAYFDTVAGRWLALRGNAVGYSGPAADLGPGAASLAAESISIDLDGDGKRDLLIPALTLTPGSTWTWLHHTGGSTYVRTATNVANVAAPGGTIAADIDGDGRDDLVYVKKNSPSIHWRRNLTTGGTPSFAAEAVLWTSPYGTAAPPAPFGTQAQRFRSIVRRGDFNGDGRTDLLFQQQYSCGPSSGCYGTRIEWHALVSQGTSLVKRAVFVTDTVPSVGDFNGDGLSDVLHASLAADGQLYWRVQLATGASAPASAAFAAPAVTTVPASQTSLVVLDWDADGRTDVLYPTVANEWQYCRANGSTFDACATVGGIGESFSAAPMPTEVNGDGIPDIVYPTTEWRYRLRQPGQRDLLSLVTDGLGNTTRFSYSTLSDRAVHTPTSGAVFPVREISLPLVVVASIVASDGSGSTYSTAMSYGGARAHVQGRGFLGFARRTSVDSRTGVARVEDSLQNPANFETLGLPASVLLRQASGQPLERTSYTWSKKEFGAGFDLRRFAFPSAIVTDRFELDGTRVASSTATYAYDDFGSPTEQAITVSEVARGLNPGAQHTRRVTSTVLNDTTYWCIGRPLNRVERGSHTLGGGAEIVRTRSLSWDPAKCRRTQEVIEPLNTSLQVVSDVAYDAYGNPASVTVTPAGQPARRTAYSWSENGRFPGVVDAPEAHLFSATWNSVSAQRTQLRDPNGRLVQWRYDALDRPVLRIEPDGTSRSFARVNCTPPGTCAWSGAAYAVRESWYAVGGTPIRTDETGYDAFDRPVYAKQEQAGSVQSLTVRRFDSRGLLSQSSLPSVCCAAPTRWIGYTYDVAGRPVSVERPAGQSDATPVAWRYRHDGLSVTETDPLGRTSTLRTDAVGNVLQSVDAAGAVSAYEYDALGHLVKARDAAGSETSIAYNLGGLRTRLADPDAGTWTFTYSALGELTSQTNARGQVTTFTYDLLGRPVTRSEPEGVTTWTWGHAPAAFNVGTLASVSSPGIQETYTYDAVGRPVAVARTAAGVTLTTGFDYDPGTGLLNTLTYPSMAGVAPFRLRHVQDRGRVVQLLDADNPATVFWRLDAVNAAGQVTGYTLGNGVKGATTIDAVTGLPLSKVAGLPGGAGLQQIDYAWDVVGNLRDRNDTVRNLSEQFAYDSRDRLDTVRRGGVTTLDLDYDDVGNVTFKSDVGPYRYDATRRHAVVAAGSNAYSYDASGSVVNANGSTISWLSYGLPGQLTHPAGNYSAFYYDADRARYRQVARSGASLTDTLYAMGGLYERYVRDGATYERQYVVADGRAVAVRNRSGTSSPAVTYLLDDHLGGIDTLLSPSGGVLARLSFQPMGGRRSGDGSSTTPSAAEWSQIAATTARGFTGHEHLDNLGIIHMNGRVYDPTLGRFLSPDPVVQSPYDGQNLNRYSYVINNPLRYTDPSGYCFNDHPAADIRIEQCLQQIIVNAFRADASAYGAWLDFSAATIVQNAAQAGSVSAADLAYVTRPMDEVVVTASRIEAPDTPAPDPTMHARYPSWLLDGTGARVGSELVLAVVIAAAIAEPTPFGEAAVGSALAGRAAATDSLSEVFHYTFQRFTTSIRNFGLRPGSYASPNGTLTPLQAQIDLALPPNRGMVDTVLRIDVAGLRQAGYEIPGASPVFRGFNMPGGGLELRFPYSIPPEFITVVGP